MISEHHDDSDGATLSEEQFRSQFDSVSEYTSGCAQYSSNDSEMEFCGEPCRWLAANDYSAEPRLYGINCSVNFLCWGGDTDDITAEAFCERCTRERRLDQLRWEREDDLKFAKEEERLALQQEKRERERIHNRENWLDLTPLEFEAKCARLFETLGFLVKTTQKSNDGGIDLVLTEGERRLAVQCKYSNTPSGVRPVRELFGVINAGGYDGGFFLSKSGGTREALKFVDGLENLELWNLDRIVGVALGDR